MSSNKRGDVQRRTWDTDAFAARARARAQNEADGAGGRKVPKGERADLAPRGAGERVDTDALAGTTVVIPEGGPKSDAGGFYCRACDVLLHDSSAYLNHVNGRAHNAVLGRAMTVRRSSAQEVRAAFAAALLRRERRLTALGRAPLTLDQLVERRRAVSAGEAEERRRERAERKGEGARLLAETKRGEAKRGEKSRVAGDEEDGEDGEDARVQAEMRKYGLPTSF